VERPQNIIVMWTTSANLTAETRSVHLRASAISHRMLRTLGREEETRAQIAKAYAGPLRFANDLDCFALGR
jgi:hypothetical protein